MVLKEQSEPAEGVFKLQEIKGVFASSFKHGKYLQKILERAQNDGVLSGYYSADRSDFK